LEREADNSSKLVLRLRVSRSVPPLLLHSFFMVWIRTILV